MEIVDGTPGWSRTSFVPLYKNGASTTIRPQALNATMDREHTYDYQWHNGQVILIYYIKL